MEENKLINKLMDITFNIMIVSLILVFYLFLKYCRKHNKKEYIFKLLHIYLSCYQNLLTLQGIRTIPL